MVSDATVDSASEEALVNSGLEEKKTHAYEEIRGSPCLLATR